MEEDVFDCIYPFVGGIVSASLLLFLFIIHLPLPKSFFKTREDAEDKLPLWEKAILEKGCCTDLMTTLCAAKSLLVRQINLSGHYTQPRAGELRWDGHWWKLWSPDNERIGVFAPGDEIEFIIVDNFISKKK